MDTAKRTRAEILAEKGILALIDFEVSLRQMLITGDFDHKRFSTMLPKTRKLVAEYVKLVTGQELSGDPTDEELHEMSLPARVSDRIYDEACACQALLELCRRKSWINKTELFGPGSRI